MSEHVLKFKKILFIGSDFYSHEAGKKNLVDAFYTQGGVLNFNQQLKMYHGAKIIMKFHQNHCSIVIWQDFFKTFNFCQWLNMLSGQGVAILVTRFFPQNWLNWSYHFVQKNVLKSLCSRSWTIFTLIQILVKLQRYQIKCYFIYTLFCPIVKSDGVERLPKNVTLSAFNVIAFFTKTTSRWFQIHICLRVDLLERRSIRFFYDQSLF